MPTKLYIIVVSILIIPQLLQAQAPRPDTAFPRIDSLHAITVTGVRGSVLLKETPISIVAVSSKALSTTIQPNIIDALTIHVPGLNAVKTGPNISKPFIRGLGYNRVLTLYDGIRQEGQQWGDEHGIEVDPYSIQRAEVIKGPASLLYGSDALAGVVSLFPFIPTEQGFHGQFLQEYQSNNGLVGTALRLHQYKQAQDDKVWWWSASGSYRIAKNYSNAVDGRVYNTGFRETNAAIGAGYQHNSTHIRMHATLYNNLQGIPDGSRDSLTHRFTKQIYEADQDTLDKRPIVPTSELNSYTLSPLHQHIQHYRIYAIAQQGPIEAQLGWQQNVRREYNHPTDPDQAGLYVQLNTINYGFKYHAPRKANIDLTIGTNGMHQVNRSKDATDFPIPDYNLTDIGAYLHARWHHEKLSLSGGIRYDTRYISTSAPTRAPQLPSLGKTYTGFSSSFGVAYQLTPALTLKSNLSSGYRSPNITELASNGLDPGAHIIYLGNPNFVPETNWQQDISLEFRSKTADLTLSLFNNNIQHYIYLEQKSDSTDAQGNKTFQYQQSAARLYGVEATFSLHPESLKGFSFENSLAIVYGKNKKKEYAHSGIQGEYLPFIPPLRYTGEIEQTIIGNKIISLLTKAGLEYNAAQYRYLGLYNTETPTPAYILLHIGAGAAIKKGSGRTIQWQLQIDNLLDTRYQNNLSRLKYFGIYNMGRSINTRITIPF